MGGVRGGHFEVGDGFHVGGFATEMRMESS